MSLEGTILSKNMLKNRRVQDSHMYFIFLFASWEGKNKIPEATYFKTAYLLDTRNAFLSL